MEKGIAHVEFSLCMSCGVCVQACPFSCLVMSKTTLDAQRNSLPELSGANPCTGCGLCASACPVDCISIHS